MTPTYCVAHREPTLPPHLYDAIVDTPPRQDYEALASVVAHRALLNLVPRGDEPVAVCGYRKVVTTRPGSHKVLTTAEAKGVLRSETEPREGLEFLVCLHDFFKIGGKHRSVKQQWGACHHAADLEDGLSLAVEMGVMTQGDRERLEAEPALVEGGVSMGVFPGAFARGVLEAVVPLYDEFARRHRRRVMAYSPAQRRCLAFMAERVETHFVLREMRRRYGSPLPEELFGCLTCSWDGPWKQGTM